MSKSKEFTPYKSYIETEVKKLNLESPQEYIFHLKNNFTIVDHICHCGNKKKFRDNPNYRYGIYCSTNCANKSIANNRDAQEKKSKSCKEHYQNNDTAKTRRVKILKFYEDLRTNNSEEYEKFRVKKNQNLRNIWGKFNENKLQEIKEKQSKSSKEWWDSLDENIKNKIIKSANEGFKKFKNNLTEEEYKEFHIKAQKSREINNHKKYGVKYPNQTEEIKKKIKNTNENKGNWITEENIKDFKDYRKLVYRYTNSQPLQTLENFENRGHANKEMYHLDHKFSIFEGFKCNIPASIIGNICNLEMIIGRNNIKKSIKCSITQEELLELYNN